jgi:2,3-bisphosphoglycerate-dependent phosphoglycerate mutase
MTATRICLVRHGETAWNAERRIQGHLDIELNATGIAQAEAVSRTLANEAFSVIYSSDLARARQTGETIARAHGLLVCPAPELRERHYGLFQGRTCEEAKVEQPEHYERYRVRDPHFIFGSGESLMAFSERIRGRLEQLALEHAGETILAVTHGGVLDVIYRMITAMPLTAPRNFGIPNAGVNWIMRDTEGWRLMRWADDGHLQSSLDEMPG